MSVDVRWRKARKSRRKSHSIPLWIVGACCLMSGLKVVNGAYTEADDLVNELDRPSEYCCMARFCGLRKFAEFLVLPVVTDSEPDWSNSRPDWSMRLEFSLFLPQKRNKHRREFVHFMSEAAKQLNSLIKVVLRPFHMFTTNAFRCITKTEKERRRNRERYKTNINNRSDDRRRSIKHFSREIFCWCCVGRANINCDGFSMSEGKEKDRDAY